MSNRVLCSFSNTVRNSVSFARSTASAPLSEGEFGVIVCPNQSWYRCSPTGNAICSRFPGGGRGHVANGVYAHGGFSRWLKSSTNSPAFATPQFGSAVYRNLQAPYVVEVLVVSRNMKKSFLGAESSSTGPIR